MASDVTEAIMATLPVREHPGMGGRGVEERGWSPWGGGGGGTDSLSLGTNCETTAPLFGHRQPPVLTFLKFTALFSWMPNDSPFNIDGEFSIFHLSCLT